MNRFWTRLPRRLFQMLGAAVGISATVIAILSYLAPQTYPVIEGPELYACPDKLEAKEKFAIKNFFDEMIKHRNSYAYIKELTIGIGGCGLFGSEYASNKPKKFNEVTATESKKSDLLTLTYHTLSNTGETYILMVHTSIDDYPFATSNCNENCIGADGVYQTRIIFNEGFVIADLARAPIVDSVARSYECAINKVKAKNWWQEFWACRL